MRRALLLPLAFLVALSASLAVGADDQQLDSRIDVLDPAFPNGATVSVYGQAPEMSDEGVLLARPADKTCDHACSPPQSSAVAVASPGTDMEEVLFRIDQVLVWGIYRSDGGTPGSPPDEDRFTVNVHLPDIGAFHLPGTEICSRPDVVSTREVVDSFLGFDVYGYTLHLPAPCLGIAPPNDHYWIEIFNDTGPADDWFWLGGKMNFSQWPPDCCWQFYGFGTAADWDHAPGEEWVQIHEPHAFTSVALLVGETQDLRLSKVAGGDLLLEWAGDCGGGVDFSVYRGSLVEGYSSLRPEPGHCDVSGTSVTVPAGEGEADFFLVAPWVEAAWGSCVLWNDHCRSQGSYGTDSGGATRPQPADRCYWKVSSDLLHDCAD